MVGRMGQTVCIIRFQTHALVQIRVHDAVDATFDLCIGKSSSVLLTRRVGPARAADLFMTGRRFTGKEAADMGIITRAVPAEELEENVKDIFVFSSAMAKSQAMARLIPPPAQAPSIQATTGFSIWRM